MNNVYIVVWVINEMTIIHQCCVFLLPFFAQRFSTFLVQKTLSTNGTQSLSHAIQMQHDKIQNAASDRWDQQMKQYATIIEQQQLKYKESHLELQHSLVRKIVKSYNQLHKNVHNTIPLFHCTLNTHLSTSPSHHWLLICHPLDWFHRLYFRIFYFS